MKKPDGWRREPARHALAAKGVETKLKKSRSGTSLTLPPKAMRSGTPAITNELKEAALDRVLQDALTEGGDKLGAVVLLENDSWLKAEAKKVAEGKASGVLQRSALRGEIIRSIRKHPPVLDEEGE